MDGESETGAGARDRRGRQPGPAAAGWGRNGTPAAATVAVFRSSAAPQLSPSRPPEPEQPPARDDAAGRAPPRRASLEPLRRHRRSRSPRRSRSRERRGRRHGRRRSRRRRNRRHGGRRRRSRSSSSSSSSSPSSSSSSSGSESPAPPMPRRSAGNAAPMRGRVTGWAASSCEACGLPGLWTCRRCAQPFCAECIVQHQLERGPHHAATRILTDREAATRIQSVARGWKSRRAMRARSRALGELLPLAPQLLEELIDEHIVEDVLPALLLEIFTQSGDGPGRDEYPDEVDSVAYAAEVLLGEVVRESVARLVRESVRAYVNDYLSRESQLRDTHPLLLVVEDVIDAGIGDAVRHTIRGVLKELVQENRELDMLDALVREVTAPLVRETAEQEYWDAAVTAYAADFVDDAVEDDVRRLASTMLADSQVQVRNQKQLTQEELIMQAAENIFLSEAMHHLVSLMTRRGEALILNEHIEFMTEQLAARLMLDTVFDVQRRRQELEQCFSLRDVHHLVTAEAGLPTLLDILDEEMDADEREIHRREKAAQAARDVPSGAPGPSVASPSRANRRR